MMLNWPLSYSTAYVHQCSAEAQEVTIARAIELKHSSSLISALANETSKIFLAAASSVKALDAIKVNLIRFAVKTVLTNRKFLFMFRCLQFGKWMRYFQFKSYFYEAYVCHSIVLACVG